MLNDLKFVQGAVAKKDYVPELTHFRISNGRVEGFNGLLALSTPTDLQIEAFPKAASFVKAVERIPAGVEVVLNLTQAGRLSVKAGNFRAYVECLDDASGYPEVAPTGEIYPMPSGILPVCRTLAPFMGIDASRQWAMGILFSGRSAFATNNIVLVEHWLGDLHFPTPINIPAPAIKELLRIGREPVGMQPQEGAITFHYDDGAWLRTALSSTDWPDLSAVLDKGVNPAEVPLLPAGFFEGVQRLDAFTDATNRLYLCGGILATAADEGTGALIELDDFGGTGIHFLSQMAALEGVADRIAFDMYPAPCLFFGGPVRGAICGLRG